MSSSGASNNDLAPALQAEKDLNSHEAKFGHAGSDSGMTCPHLHFYVPSPAPRCADPKQ